jgi:feruloyl esterase
MVKRAAMTTNHRRLSCFCVVLLLATVAPGPALIRAAPATCESLSSLKLTNGTIISAVEVDRGAFKPPTAGTVPAAAARAYAATPAFCRVTATLAPTSDSDIKVEVWLPKTGWNGKLQAVGNGGWAGTISYTALAAAVTGGYAAASTDTGHATPGSTFAIGHPEKLIDYAHRSLHELAVSSKAVTNAFYDGAPKLSLWNGCSTGGNQGLTIASKYPADFDAIVAGAPPDPRARLMSVRLLINRLVHRTPASYIPPDKYPAINQAVLNACDTLDGAKDGVIENPRACRFDPKVMECQGADGPTCLTAEQVETATLLYSDVKFPKTERVLYPPLLQPGSELAWATLAGPQPFANAVDAYRLVHKDPNWTPDRFDMATDFELMENELKVLNTVTPDLRPFFKRGGRLLMYHGWNDRQVPAMSSVTFYQRVLETAGRDAAGRSIQLYMVPGMDHCQGGIGADTFNKVAAIEEWVANGKAPAQIIASHSTDGKIDKTRPLCPFPQIARYKGTGSMSDAANFACSVK